MEYAAILKDHNRQGRDVAILLPEDLSVNINVSDISNQNLETVVLEVLLKAKHSFVTCCYWLPGTTVEQVEFFITEFENMFDSIYQSGYDSIFRGP